MGLQIRYAIFARMMRLGACTSNICAPGIRLTLKWHFSIQLQAPDKLQSSTAGVNCLDDRLWSAPRFDPTYGVCHTFNPCFGFQDAIGQVCTEDADCRLNVGKQIPGGLCRSGKCTCNLCALGVDCKVHEQSISGQKGSVALTLDVSAQSNPAIHSAISGQWVEGAVVFLHSHLDESTSEASVVLTPGMMASISIRQQATRQQTYPFSNCSSLSFTAPGLCYRNCVSRQKAVQCCGINLKAMVAGRFAENAQYDPSLGCNTMDPKVQQCLLEVERSASAGTACTPGAEGIEAVYSRVPLPFLFDKTTTGWYDGETDTDGNMILDQEETAAKIESHCIWNVTQRLQGGAIETNLGKPCKSADDCLSDSEKEERRGRCSDSQRAFCPPPCDWTKFVIGFATRSALSGAAIRLLATQELAWAGFLASAGGLGALPSKFEAECPQTSADNSSNQNISCMTLQEAKNVVRSNYAVAEFYFDNPAIDVVDIVPAVDVFTLAATIGGTVGLCIGASIMTMMEWLEMLVFALLSMPFFYCGVQLSLLKRGDQKEMPIDAVDDEVAMALKSFKKAFQLQVQKEVKVLENAQKSLHTGLDADNDGLVDIHELAVWMKSHNAEFYLGMSPEQVMDQFDVDHNARLDPTEMAALQKWIDLKRQTTEDHANDTGEPSFNRRKLLDGLRAAQSGKNIVPRAQKTRIIHHAKSTKR